MKLSLPGLVVLMLVTSAHAQLPQPDLSDDVFLPDIFSIRADDRRQLDLNGEWELQRDPHGLGLARNWHRGEGEFQDTMTVPGAPQAQGIGEPHPFQRTMFLEPFWIRRAFRAPRLDEDQRLWLRIGAILPAADVYLNGSKVGYTKSSRTPQRVDVTDYVEPGRNLLAIHVRELPNVRLDGLLEWNEGTQLWRGPYRPIQAEITHRLSVVDAYLQPDIDNGHVTVDVDLNEATDAPLGLRARILDGNRTLAEARAVFEPGQGTVRFDVPFTDFELWEPANPHLYTMRLELLGGNTLDTVSLRFGMRKFETRGTKFYLNNQPIFLRCFGDDHYYPDTLCPPHEKEWYLERLQRARDYGFNAVKGCVEVIPPDYVEACDEAGILIIQEMPFGLSTLRANRYTIEEPFLSFFLDELEGLIRVSRNHASVVSYSMSSELEIHNQTQQSFEYFSQVLPGRARELAPHAVMIDCTGYGSGMEMDKGARDTDFYAVIVPTWVKQALDEVPLPTDGAVPTVLHEYNWWSSYPDPDSAAKYEGAQLLPFWIDSMHATAEKQGVAGELDHFHAISQQHQTITRKDGIEYARRNPNAEGYILWLLIDFGHWCEGLLDDFWDPKNVSPAEFLQSNGDTVLVLAEEGKRCIEAGGEQAFPLLVDHYGPENGGGFRVHWRVVTPFGESTGIATDVVLTPGAATRVEGIVADLPGAGESTEGYALEVQAELAAPDGTVMNTNQWSYWAFEDTPAPSATASTAPATTDGIQYRFASESPAGIDPGTELLVTDFVDDALLAWVEEGGACLLLADEVDIKAKALYGTTSFYRLYRPIPWNAGDSGNSGTVIYDHPAMAAFPHDGWCDFQFVHLIRDTKPMEFEPLREFGVEPIVRSLDSYRAMRHNAYLLEFQVGAGRVLATTFRVLPMLEENIEARALLAALTDYARGDAFQPAATVPPEDFRRLFTPTPEEPAEAAVPAGE